MKMILVLGAVLSAVAQAQPQQLFGQAHGAEVGTNDEFCQIKEFEKESAVDPTFNLSCIRLSERISMQAGKCEYASGHFSVTGFKYSILKGAPGTSNYVVRTEVTSDCRQAMLEPRNTHCCDTGTKPCNWKC